jgi:tetratricopeptide (TPR) repeat protein
MIPRRRPLLFVGSLMTIAVVTVLLFRVPAPPSAAPAPVAQPVTPVGVAPLREEALALYAAGDFPPACERFSRAAADEPGDPARQEDAASCFEAWAWRALRENRPEEATALFAQGLRERPGTPGLLRGVGIAAIHAGRRDDAFAPLEAAVAATGDADVHVLLARLYDQRDDSTAAIDHLRASLTREPRHARATALLRKIERERGAEAGFRRASTAHFVVKWRGAIGTEPPRDVLRFLEIAYSRLDARLGYRPADRVSVVLYGDRQFHDVTRAHGLVSGLFDGKIRLPVGTAMPAGPALERLIVHEYAHAAIHDLSRGRAPRWLHEGLAQLLEGAPVDSALRIRGTMTLDALERLMADRDPARARTGYDVALWIVHDLSMRGGMTSLRALLDRLATGEPTANALARAYGMRLPELESQWHHLLGT